MAVKRPKTYVVVLERAVLQTARVELQARSLREAEDAAKRLAQHDEAISWDTIEPDRTHVLHVEE